MGLKKILASIAPIKK
ncbi:MAG: hypothetical protein ACYDIA_20610 [Candidatus Humimicrobiaceae bacterium]